MAQPRFQVRKVFPDVHGSKYSADRCWDDTNNQGTRGSLGLVHSFPISCWKLIHSKRMIRNILVIFPTLFMVMILGQASRNSLAWSVSVSRVRFQSSAQPVVGVKVNPRHLLSQDGEDRQLLEWFGGLTNGTYLEIGALDGIQYSNSYVFNKDLGWRGVLIEISEKNFGYLIRNRPHEIATIHAGVCDTKQRLHYVEKGGPTGGIWELAPQSFKDQWWRGLTLDSPQVRPVDCAPLTKLLETHVGHSFFFDFWSLDVEGAEWAILQTLDFSRFGFGIILTEADAHNPLKNLALRQFLESHGYSFLMEYGRSDWFVNDAFAEIYGDKLLPANANVLPKNH